jgi:hypothetical protein
MELNSDTAVMWMNLENMLKERSWAQGKTLYYST